jgi:TonB-linked SusC/RagA family outer membrane protein
MKTKLTSFLTLLLLLVLQTSWAQTNINGVVTDQAGLPLPGVNVLVKGTQNGVQTDFDGKFSIAANAGDKLVFSFIGMKTVEIAAAPNMKVTMADNAVELEGVVVTALGIKREKKALGYSATTVKSEQLTQVVNSNVFESLSGKIAGVDITTPQQIGATSKIIVRGISSITGSNAPLYVIDGTPINNAVSGYVGIDRSYDAGSGINDLDPNSIESITFLKGAAASALYGSRGSNGVFIITTKKGKAGKIKVDFLSSVEASQVARITHMQNSYGEGWSGLGYSNTPSGVSNENGSWGPAFNGEIRPWGQVVNNSQLIKPYVALEDNLRDFYATGMMQTNYINVSGGSDNSDFSLGFTNLSSDGIIPTDSDKYIKRTLAFNGGLKSDKFTLRTSINYTNREQNAVNTGQGDEAGEGATLQQDLMQIPRDVSILDLADYKNNPFNTPDNYFTPYSTNPYFDLGENSTYVQGNNIFGNINMSYKLTPKLTAAWQFGGNYRNESTKSYGAIVSYDPDGPIAGQGGTNIKGGVTEARVERSEVDTYATLTYDTDITDKFHFNILGGVAYNQREGNSLFTSVTGLSIPNYYEISNSANFPTITQNNTLRRTFGVYGQAELSYDNKYFLTLSARNDKSSTLPVNNNSYFYPAISASAALIDDGKNYLKLRAGIAAVANDTDPYQTEASLTQANASAYFGTITAPIGGVNYYELSGILGNSELKPERTTETEIGVEGNLFSNRITFDISAYYSKTKDLIVAVPLDPSTGFSTQAANVADLQNKGVEVALGFTPVKTNDFRWDLNYTFSKNLNEVTSLRGGSEKVLLNNAYNVNFYAVQGQPIGVFYAVQEQRTPDGQIIVNPDTGYAEVTDEKPIGNSQRDFVMGLQNTLKYKNVSLSFNIDWKQGGKMYSYTDRLNNFTGNSIASTYNGREPFIIPNSVVEDPDNPGQYIENTTPIAYESIVDYFGNTTENQAIEQTHVIDKSFVRLRELNITYSFGKKITDSIGLSNLSLSLYGKNLFLWTPDSNPYVDPEISTFGNEVASEFGEFAANPSQRSYGAILKLSF